MRFRDEDVLTWPKGRLDFSAGCLVMGILNVTLDSFSDGGEFFDPDRAVEHGLQMVADGAAIIDVGGESTRPGSASVTAREQIERVVPAQAVSCSLRFSSAAMALRISNFWIFPATVIGNSSTKRM